MGGPASGAGWGPQRGVGNEQYINLSSKRLHDTRHGAITLLLNGVDIRTGSGILGDSVATRTLSICARLMADTQRDAIDTPGRALMIFRSRQRAVKASS